MFEIAYDLAVGPGRRREDRVELSVASSVDLLYSCFVGNVALRVGSVDFSANFDWIPLLSFANNVDLIVGRLASGEKKFYYFTESEDWISFSECEGDIEIECSYLPGEVGIANSERVRKDVRLAGLNFVSHIERQYSEIGGNAVFSDISSRMRRE